MCADMALEAVQDKHVHKACIFRQLFIRGSTTEEQEANKAKIGVKFTKEDGFWLDEISPTEEIDKVGEVRSDIEGGDKGDNEREGVEYEEGD